MKDIFILGATKYSFMIHEFIRQEKQYEVIGHTVNCEYLKDVHTACQEFGTSLFPLEELNRYVGDNQEVFVLNTIGYTNMNKTRQRLHENCISMGYIPINYVSNRAIVLSEIQGSGNIVFPSAYIGTGVHIGDCNVFYAGCVITHDIDIGNSNFFAANVTIGGETQIRNNCFIGMGSTIRNRLDVKDYSLIGAAAYLSHDTHEYEVVVPAKSITLEKNSLDVSLTPKNR